MMNEYLSTALLGIRCETELALEAVGHKVDVAVVEAKVEVLGVAGALWKNESERRSWPPRISATRTTRTEPRHAESIVVGREVELHLVVADGRHVRHVGSHQLHLAEPLVPCRLEGVGVRDVASMQHEVDVARLHLLHHVEDIHVAHVRYIQIAKHQERVVAVVDRTNSG